MPSLAMLLDLLHGAGITVIVSGVAILAGVPLGLALAAGRTGQAPLIRSACALYSSFVRAVPVVTFVLLIYFGLPRLGLALNPLPAARSGAPQSGTFPAVSLKRPAPSA